MMNYTERKARGLIRLDRIGSKIVATIKKFDPETGDEIEPETAVLNVNEIVQEVTRLATAIRSLNDLLTDMDQLLSNDKAEPKGG